MDGNPPGLARNSRILVLVTFLLAAGSMCLRPSVLLRPVAGDLQGIRRNIGFWSGTDIDPGPSVCMLPNSKVIMRRYSDIAGGEFTLTVVCGLDLASLRRPEYCVGGSCWRTVSSRSTEVTSASGEVFPAKLLRVKSPDSRELICLYWFTGHDGSCQVLKGRKWDMIGRVLYTGKLRPPALVRLTAPAGDDPRSTEETLILLGGVVDAQVRNALDGERCAAPIPS